jgi:hypothetical protein
MGEPEGGLGGATGRCIRDARLVERAHRERWPIPKALRGPLIDRLARIVQDPEASPREATSAAKAILSASKINLEVVMAIVKASTHNPAYRNKDVQDVRDFLSDVEDERDFLAD